MTLISVILLALPLAYHIWNDRNGEKPSEKAIDILIVSLIAIAASVVGFFISGKPIIDCLFLSFAIHFMFFDYLIVIILKKRGVIETKQSVFEYLGSSYTDDVLRQWKPWTRFIIKAIILTVAIVVYIWN